jgi:glyoxylase-like metal-dependent hydrolase (beta-lactamase superfamily II)
VREELADHGIVRLRAENPGPLTLSGTNTWVVGSDPAWVVDPGPALDEHLQEIRAEVAARGGLGGIALTHDHADHSEATGRLLELAGAAPVAAARGEVDLLIGDGDEAGPLLAVASPGHAPDHLAFVTGGACFTGDAVLGEGSVFIQPGPGSLRGYLHALGRLRDMDLAVLCPGHGPVIADPTAKLDEYIAHRLDRERRLVEALDSGLRSEGEILNRVWDDAPDFLRPVAAITLRAHLEKLDEEGRLPADMAFPG